MPRSDKHNYARQQHANEVRKAHAKRDLDTHLVTGEVAVTTDWDAALAELTAPAKPADGPSPSDLHKPDHGGYPS